MIPSLLIAMALTIHLAQDTGTSTLTRPEPGLWGAQAVHLSESATVGATSQGGRIVEVMSPDRLKAVSVRDYRLNIEVSGRSANPREPIAIGSLAEVLWAPDS